MWIIIIIVLLLGFGYFKAKNQMRSAEFGKEARHIALNELGVPPSYFMYLVQNDIENVKKAAMQLKETNAYFNSLSYPRLLAWAIYGGFRYDCHYVVNEHDMNAAMRLRNAGVTIDEIHEEMEEDHKGKGLFL